MAYNLPLNASNQQISSAVNYLISNFTSGVNANQVTGVVSGPGNQIINYLYQYLDVKYATSYDGSQGFSNSPTGATYYGLRNTNSTTDDSNYTDYIWYDTIGFGSTNFLWYTVTGGRSINFFVGAAAPDTGWVKSNSYYINLDVVTSGNIPIITENFASYFTPSPMLVPRTGSPLAPVFTNLNPTLYSTNAGSVVQFSAAQTDSDVSFGLNTWRIGNSSTTGNADISYLNLTIGNPSLVSTYAQWPTPTAMPNSPAFITVPIRYKNASGVISQSNPAVLQLVYSDPGQNGANGSQGVSIDISGFTSFTENAGGAFTPTSATLSALLTNVTSPTYSWAIVGGTPTSATTASIVVTPNNGTSQVSATLTVTGSNVSGSLSKTVNMPIVYDGAAGTAGANGYMSAFPTIYQWTGSSTPPTRPSTTSTFTWATAGYTAPTGWSTTAPSNTTPGNYLWSITVPLNTVATTTTSTIDWTNTSNPIRSISYNGGNGTNGTNGSNGSATFVVTRTAADSSAPTNAEVYAAIGRYPVAGDICTLSYNNYNNAEVWNYTTSWVLFTTYITGSLIVQNTITGDKLAANTVTASNINSNNLTIKDASGNVLFGAGTPLNYSNITPSTSWLNSNISIGSNGSLSGAGGGQVTIGGLGYTGALNANYTYLDGSGNIQGVGSGAGTTVANNAISIVSGAIQGIGTGAGTNVANSFITMNADGTLAGAGGGQVTIGGLGFTGSLNANYTYLDGSGNIQGVGSGAGTTVANNVITVNANGTLNNAGSGQVTATGINAVSTSLSNAPAGILNSSISIVSGLIQGIGTGNSTPVANALISINPNGTLSGAGGGSVTISGLGYNGSLYATQNNVYIQSTQPSSAQNGDIWVNTANTQTFVELYSGGSWQTSASYGAAFGTNIYGQINSSNASTYIANAAIGTAQVGVLQAGNIGAGQIDATKINVSNLSAISANMGTITAGTLASGTIIAGSLSSATGTFIGTLQVGSSPAITGSTMTGSGALFNNTGTFAIGNSTTNITFNSGQMTLNGNVVATANINPNAVTNVAGNSTAGSCVITSIVRTVTSVPITTSGGNVVVTVSGIASFDNTSTAYSAFTENYVVYVYRDTTLVYSATVNFYVPDGGYGSSIPGVTFVDTPSAGAHTYYYKINSPSGGADPQFQLTAGYLVLQEFKR